MFLEVIAISLDDIKIINQVNNVDRIELCSNMEQGGLIPTYELIEECCKLSKVPVRVMLRYDNNNFFFNLEHFARMKSDIKFIKTTKAEGIVVGFLNDDYTINYDHLKQLIMIAYPLKVTFHRAFDLIDDKVKAIKTLAELGVTTVLTLGDKQKPILQNLECLQNLKGHGIQIQAGSGINFENYKLISQYADAIHIGSAIRNDND